MSLSTLFDKLAGKQRDRRQRHLDSYRDLVAGVATGEEPDADEVERLLADAGKSLDDLRHDVERYQHRMALKAMVASLPKWEDERRLINEQIAAADQALEAAEKQHDETSDPLFNRRREIDAAISDAQRARVQLIETCDDAEARREASDLNVEHQRLEQEQRAQADRASHLEKRARAEFDQADRMVGLSDAEARREVAERYQKDAEAARREVKRLEKAKADVAKRREQLDERMRQA
jgi:hypothetical protein